MSAANKALIAAVAAALPSSPPPSPLTSLSSPLPEIPSPPLCLPSPLLPLPVPSSPLLLPSTNRREDVPEADAPPQKRLCLTAHAPRFKVGERSAAAAARQLGLDVTRATYYSFVDTMDATPGCPMSREVGYGIMGVWDDMVGDMEERAPTTLRFKTKDEARDNRLRTREPEPARDLEPQDGPADAGSSSQGVATTLAEYEAHRSSRNGDELLGHFKRDCPNLEDNSRGNQSRNGRATARAYTVGNAGKNLDSNVVMVTFLLNNCYASILFDTGADRSFVSTSFSSLIDIIPTALDHDYDVELADGKII
ncbi:reverse transcriptase domain-containing protein [Tanacetum coccineum]